MLNMRHSHATHDLVNSIADGDFPSWTLEVQTMDPAKEGSLDFDPLDCTKVCLLLPAVTRMQYAMGMTAAFGSGDLNLDLRSLIATLFDILTRPDPQPQ